jgi:hypothetical protein
MHSGICGSWSEGIHIDIEFIQLDSQSNGKHFYPRLGDIVNKKLDEYVNRYVICKECKRPDTKLVKEDRISFLKCEACGAKSSIKAIK